MHGNFKKQCLKLVLRCSNLQLLKIISTFITHCTVDGNEVLFNLIILEHLAVE